jgi:hypothetical protein
MEDFREIMPLLWALMMWLHAASCGGMTGRADGGLLSQPARTPKTRTNNDAMNAMDFRMPAPQLYVMFFSRHGVATRRQDYTFSRWRHMVICISRRMAKIFQRYYSLFRALMFTMSALTPGNARRGVAACSAFSVSFHRSATRITPPHSGVRAMTFVVTGCFTPMRSAIHSISHHAQKDLA